MIVGAGVLAAIGDIKRFASPKKLAAYFGVVPSTKQSGDTEARHGCITKQGNSRPPALGRGGGASAKIPGLLRVMFQRNKQRGHSRAEAHH